MIKTNRDTGFIALAIVLALCIIFFVIADPARADPIDNATSTYQSTVPTQADKTEQKASNALFIADSLLLTADWLQTRDIAYQCPTGRYYEMTAAAFIGHCPTMHGVNNYFALYGATFLAVNYYSPLWFKSGFNVYVAATEGSVVAGNYKIGLHFKFK